MIYVNKFYSYQNQISILRNVKKNIFITKNEISFYVSRLINYHGMPSTAIL